ncbi:MAG: Flp family type IVb pilin [Dongiaceae bacterium]
MPIQLLQFIADESGASAIEYALVAVLVGIAMFGALGALGDSVADLYGNVHSSSESAIADAGVPLP